MDRLVVTTVSLGSQQLKFIKANCDNVSRYIRSLIDREIGASNAGNEVNQFYQNVNNQPVLDQETEKQPQKVTVWNFPK